MIGPHPARPGGAHHKREGAAATFRPAEWLSLAASPTFAIMALLAALEGSPMDGLCSSGQGAPMSGMATMYLLMSAFHSPLWLRRISSRRARAGRERPS